MRRALCMLVAAAAGVAVLVGAGGRGTDSYRVAAVFSNAAGLIPGQNVEIAGAIVGKVQSIRLTPEHRARVEMDVKSGFVPFRADANCEIKPQSLIGEKFIECDPGSPDGEQLASVDGTPTVPLAHTRAPVDIDLVFAALREPYVNRLSLVVNELGTGLAGRPHDLQVAIRRSAPALQEFDRVLRIVNRDRALLGNLIDRTDTVLARVTPRSRDVTSFVERASRVGDTVAQRRDALAAGLDRLPPLLAELEPSARSLAGAARDARPVVHQLRQATPSLRDLFSDLAPLTDAGRPALSALESASDEGRQAVSAARPVATRLRSASTLIPHVAQVADAVVTSLKDAGGVEAINTFAWLGTAAMARFDKTSHIIPSYQLTVGTCNVYATEPVDGCSAHWAGSAAAKAAAKERKAKRHTAKRKHRRHLTPDEGVTPRQPGDTGSGSAPSTQLPSLPKLPDLPPLPGGVKPPQLPGSGSGDRDDSAEKLLDFLMGK
jgi:phospholipid/cholesterol/gamma-HCH transport system substrate-binding protein